MDHASAIESRGLSFALASALGVAAIVYYRGWLRLRRLIPGIASPWYPSAFFGGLVVVWIAMGSPLAACDERLLSLHMVQHLLLTLVAAPFLLLGAPALPLLYGLPAGVRAHGLAPMLRFWPVRAASRFLRQPAVCWTLAMLVFLGWHIPAIFELGRRTLAWHVLEHTSFLVSGLLFWWPVVQPWPSRAAWPRWSIPLYLFLATLPCDGLSAFLAFSDRVVYAAYLSAPQHSALSVLQDQEYAGALMWLCVTIAYAVPAALITISVLSPKREHFARPWDTGHADAPRPSMGERVA